MAKNVLVVVLTLGVVGGAASRTTAQNARDGCALLQAAEIQALSGSVQIGAGKATTDTTLGARTCAYEWGTGGNVQSGKSFLNVIATPTSKAFPGVDSASLRQGLLATAGPNNPKDVVENKLKAAICSGTTDLVKAQQAIAHDWTTALAVLGIKK